MPRLETMPNPADPTQELTAWAWAHVTNFDHGSKVVVVDWQYFASHAAAYTPGAAPILHRTQVFRAEAVEARYGQPPELTALVPAEYGDPDPETGERPLISPEVPATYGPAPLLSPRVPSYGEIMDPILAGEPVNVLARVDQLGVEAFGGVAVPAGPPSQDPPEG